MAAGFDYFRPPLLKSGQSLMNPATKANPASLPVISLKGEDVDTALAKIDPVAMQQIHEAIQNDPDCQKLYKDVNLLVSMICNAKSIKFILVWIYSQLLFLWNIYGRSTHV